LAGQQWSQIDTAPRDGTRVLLAIDHRDGCDKVWTGLLADGWIVSYGKPTAPVTHWMDLPDAPHEKAND